MGRFLVLIDPDWWDALHQFSEWIDLKFPTAIAFDFNYSTNFSVALDMYILAFDFKKAIFLFIFARELLQPLDRFTFTKL